MSASAARTSTPSMSPPATKSSSARQKPPASGTSNRRPSDLHFLVPGLCPGTHCFRGSASVRSIVRRLFLARVARLFFLGQACHAVVQPADQSLERLDLFLLFEHD